MRASSARFVGTSIASSCGSKVNSARPLPCWKTSPAGVTLRWTMPFAQPQSRAAFSCSKIDARRSGEIVSTISCDESRSSSVEPRTRGRTVANVSRAICRPSSTGTTFGCRMADSRRASACKLHHQAGRLSPRRAHDVDRDFAIDRAMAGDVRNRVARARGSPTDLVARFEIGEVRENGSGSGGGATGSRDARKRRQSSRGGPCVSSLRFPPPVRSLAQRGRRSANRRDRRLPHVRCRESVAEFVS